MRVLVIGAGPMGLEAALCCAERGHEVSVLEQGQVGDGLRRWGPVRLFTPLGMNLSLRARALLGATCPGEDALLTGPELAERVLAPLAATAPLAGRVRTGHRVLAVGRARLGRGELVGHPLRADRPFRLLVEGPEGEHWLEADRVLDASGVYGRPTWAGAGGLPAPGERALGPRVIRDLGTLAVRLSSLAGRRVLLVGHGHSAAHAAGLLCELVSAAPDTRLTWAVRSAHQRPCVAVAGDPLPERRAVVERANDLAARPPAQLQVERRAHLEGFSVGRSGAITVSLTGGRRLEVDEVVALTGYRPDLSFLSELALAIAPASEGAAALELAVSMVTDCLAVPRVGLADLSSGEPGFWMVGAKSYGRARTFLLQTGLGQLETIVANL